MGLSLEVELVWNRHLHSAAYGVARHRRNLRITNAFLACSVWVTPQSMQCMLVTLERNGLIVRTSNPEHGTIIMKQLSEIGGAAARGYMIAGGSVGRQLLSVLMEDKARLPRYLVQRSADAHGGR